MTVKEKIKSVRPPLYYIAPLTYTICWGYAITNVFLGAGLYELYKPQVPIAVANVFSYQVWGILFFLSGVVSIYALLKNEWWITRQMLIVGITLKAIWAIALIIRCFTDPMTTIITLVWLFFAYVQAMTYIYFMPRVKIKGKKSYPWTHE